MKAMRPTAAVVLLAAAVSVLFGGSMALATEGYRNGVTMPVGTTGDGSLQPGTSADLLDTEGETLVTCTGSTLRGKITNAGSSTETSVGLSEEMSFNSCTIPVKTIQLGSLEVHHIAGTTNGTVTAKTRFEVTITTIFFGSCIYGVTAGSDLGLSTSGKATGEVVDDPVLHTTAVVEKLSGSALACPSTTTYSATYSVTSPSGVLTIEAS